MTSLLQTLDSAAYGCLGLGGVLAILAMHKQPAARARTVQAGAVRLEDLGQPPPPRGGALLTTSMAFIALGLLWLAGREAVGP